MLRVVVIDDFGEELHTRCSNKPREFHRANRLASATVVTAMKAVLARDSLITADAGYHSKGNLKELAELGVEALIADNALRRRDERFATQERYRQAPDPLYNKAHPANNGKSATYRAQDFTYDPIAQTCVCPAGKSLYRNGSQCLIRDFVLTRFRGTKRDCVPCSQRQRCLRTPQKTQTRQVAFVRPRAATASESHTERMKRRIDSPEGRARYAMRFGAVEPVFGNLRYNKGLDRFTLRGRAKVDAQWKLFCLVHNIEKLANHGYAA